MQYVLKKSQAKAFSEHGISTFFDYGFPVKNASLGVSEIHGKYPESGFDVDEKVEASWYVESGRGSIWIGGEERSIETGDMVYVPAGEKFWIKGEYLRLIVCSSPVWYPEQHKHIEE